MFYSLGNVIVHQKLRRIEGSIERSSSSSFSHRAVTISSSSSRFYSSVSGIWYWSGFLSRTAYFRDLNNEKKYFRENESTKICLHLSKKVIRFFFTSNPWSQLVVVFFKCLLIRRLDSFLGFLPDAILDGIIFELLSEDFRFKLALGKWRRVSSLPSSLPPPASSGCMFLMK